MFSLHIKENQSTNTVNCQYFKDKIHSKLLISQNEFSGPRKFTLRYQQDEITGVEK